jgi:hypothetical protein
MLSWLIWEPPKARRSRFCETDPAAVGPKRRLFLLADLLLRDMQGVDDLSTIGEGLVGWLPARLSGGADTARPCLTVKPITLRLF